jgi:hypothetical protein
MREPDGGTTLAKPISTEALRWRIRLKRVDEKASDVRTNAAAGAFPRGKPSTTVVAEK